MATSNNSSDSSEFPFMLSRDEDQIVHHSGSVLLCGRSGTGKTSVSVFRLLSMFYVYYANTVLPLYSQPSETMMSTRARQEASNFHQIFLTASPDFCVRVRAYFQGLLASVTRGANKYPQSEIELQTIAQKADEFIKRLDISKATDANSLHVVLGDDPRSSGSHVDDAAVLIEEDMENQLLASVPDSLLDLKDEHFPLFITYRKFANMIRKAFGLDQKTSTTRFLEMSQSGFDLSNEIDYPTFVHKYWNHLDAKLTNKMDSSLAYNEIMGIIKGSEAAATSSSGFLTREQYQSLSERSYGLFKGVREKLYDIFLAYQKMKIGEQDPLDRFVSKHLTIHRLSND
jgi:hypothetical protein